MKSEREKTGRKSEQRLKTKSGMFEEQNSEMCLYEDEWNERRTKDRQDTNYKDQRQEDDRRLMDLGTSRNPN